MSVTVTEGAGDIGLPTFTFEGWVPQAIELADAAVTAKVDEVPVFDDVVSVAVSVQALQAAWNTREEKVTCPEALVIPVTVPE